CRWMPAAFAARLTTPLCLVMDSRNPFRCRSEIMRILRKKSEPYRPRRPATKQDTNVVQHLHANGAVQTSLSPAAQWYLRSTLAITSLVFVQSEVEPSAAEAEAAWVSALAKKEPQIQGMVAWAALEKGSAVREDLERLKRHSILRGIRRIIQFEPDLDF